MQYLPNKKHARWGIKVWLLSDPTNGYLYRFYLYGGRADARSDMGKPEVVVKHLVEMVPSMTPAGHSVVTDNCFTSLRLARYMRAAGSDLSGTVRANRLGLPGEVRFQNLSGVKSGTGGKGEYCAVRGATGRPSRASVVYKGRCR